MNLGFPPPDKYRERMDAVNRRGIWWCPHCIKFRHFEKRRGFYYEEIWVPGEVYVCPTCEVSHTSGYVRQYNPVAGRIAIGKRTKGGRKRGRRRK